MLSKDKIVSALAQGFQTWNGLGYSGQPLTVSFSFFSELPSYYLNSASGDININLILDAIEQNKVEPFNSAQQQAFLKALLAWESVANITFVDAGFNNTAATIAVAGTAFKFDSEYGGYPYAVTQFIQQSTSAGANSSWGDIWINTDETTTPGLNNTTLTEPMQDGYETLLHEMGHALGLGHPNGEAYSEDQLHTTMSYTKANITYDGVQWYPSAPMLYDILAIQTMYGPNMQNHQFDDTYTFSTDANRPSVEALWDAGGNDTFNAGNQTASVFINLNPGEFSSIGTGDRDKAYIAIAYNVGVDDNYIENAIGGSANDELIGNNADNQLFGGEGEDTMLGGLGNDAYIIDNAGDVVVENANEGTDDTVLSSVTYTLGENIEWLILTGTDAVDGTGNALNNVLNGNNAANTLDGGTGADTLIGGAGDDTYQIDNTGDVVSENANEGTDTVRSSISYALGANVEKLILTGTGAVDATGNELNNILTGNNAANILVGGAGKDTLISGVGEDTLIGGEGNDILHGDDGAGGDILDGGSGFDTYYADNGDTIRDSDGKGTIYLNGKQLTFATRNKGETLYKDANGNTYIQAGSTLLINDPLIIENFSSGDLDITLDEYDPNDPLKKAFGKAEQTKSPIILDLNGNGIATQNVNHGAFFDYDGNGFAERTGWATSGDGLLVRDLNANGRIDNGTELFGDRTLLQNGQTAANGFAAMADLDSNGDGKLDSQDSAWTELNIWQDQNSDGMTDAGELKSLSELGVQSIATGYTSNTSTDVNGNIHQQQGSYIKTDGSTALAEDIWFKADLASTRNTNLLTISEAIHNMPEIQGKGNVASLRQVMEQQAANGSSVLKNLIDQFAAESNPVARNALTTQIIYEWTGVTDKNPLSRAATRIYGNAIGDARKLYAMEALLGEGYEGTWCWGEKDPNPHGPAAAVLLKAYDEFANGITAQLMQQTRLKDLYNAIVYTWDATSQTLHGDLNGTLPIIATQLEANRDQGKNALGEFITNLIYTNNVNELDTRAFQEALGGYGQDVLSISIMAWRGMIATQGNDRLTGNSTDEIIAGWDGNDLIYGGGGNDRLLGEEGRDGLYGQDGNDTLDGGAGDDLLDGGAGNDTYLFGRTSGQETILSQDGTVNKRDVLKLAVDVLPTDIDLIRNIDDLILTIRDTGDRVTVTGYFVNDGVSPSSLEAIEFNNGTTWDFAAVKAMLPSLGTEGNDQIRGYNTAELINGLGGNDVIEGRGGDDAIAGGSGNDTLFGQEGNDTLDGSTGNDSLQGGIGNDTYLFNLGGGQDTVYDYDITAGNVDAIRMAADIATSDMEFGSRGNDLILNIKGTTGQLRIQNWSYGDAYRIEQVEFADGTVWGAADLPSQLSGLPIIGTSGSDSLSGDDGNNTLDGKAGNDNLQGGAGDDIYLFNLGDGQDWISDYDSSLGNGDTIRFGAGILASNILFGRSGVDLTLSINGTTGQLRIQNWGYGDAYHIERVEFADGTVWGAADLPSQLSGLPIMGTSGNDSLYGDAGNNTLDGRAGNDTLQGGAGNDIYLFNLGDGQDRIYEYDSTLGNVDTIRFGAGIAAGSIIFTPTGNDLVLSINGMADQLTIQNWKNNDAYRIERIEFADGMSWDAAYLQIQALAIVGTAGNDNLSGGAGNNILDGRAGNDTLQGGAGNDIYLFNLGDGQDTLYDSDSSIGNVDTIRFGAGIVASDIIFIRNGNDLVLSIKGTTDQLKIQNWGYGDYYHIERMEFADGTLWDAAYLQAQIFAQTLVGTAGDDTLSLWASDGGTLLQGIKGNDRLTGNSGNDTLAGGVGNDTLDGGTGNDVYLFNLGDGQDTLYDSDSTIGNVDIVRFGVGIAASDISFSNGYGGDLVLSINGTTDQLKTQSRGSWDYCIERIEFVDGTVWDTTSLPIVGTTGNDYLLGNIGNNTLDGRAGNDYLSGGTGNDVYLFNLGGGQDTLYDFDSTTGNVDTLRFGVGIVATDINFGRRGADLLLDINGSTDQVKIQSFLEGNNYRIERVEFADGTVWGMAEWSPQLSELPIMGTSGNDYLYGDTGNNTLNGGAGNDTLQGGWGNDVYLFNLGSGQDSILDADSTAGNVDIIRFGAGIATGDIIFGRHGNDLVLTIKGTVDRLTIRSWDYENAYRIEQIEFADGTVWGTANLPSQLSGLPIIGGTEQSDYLQAGIDENAILLGLGGNDSLYGSNGNDILDGGVGDDYLNGGSGNDIYVFGLGDGHDIFCDIDNTTGNIDTILFGAGIATNDITFSHSEDKWYGSDLILRIKGTYDEVIIQYWTYGDITHVERVKFADGTWWDTTQLQAFVSADPISGTKAADSLQALAGKNAVIQGLDGDDSLYGNDGNDFLDGGTGNDFLQDGMGNDTYLFNRGGGQDTISDSDSTAGNVDTIRFDVGIVASDITFSRSDSDLVLSINGTTDQLTIIDWNVDTNSRIEQVQFRDGTSWDSDQLQTFVSAIPISGTEEADSLQAWVAENTTLQGLGGDDSLYGNDGNDILNGGIGNDYLSGGTGDDTYLFNLGDGQDTVIDGQGWDILYIGGNLIAADLGGVRDGDNMIVNVLDTADSITLANWFVQSEGIYAINFSDGSSLYYIEGLLNRPPVANPDAITVFEDGDVMNVPAAVLLANDTDPNADDVISVIAVGASAIGASVLLVNGQVRYDIGNRYQELGAEQTVTDSFNYTISDSKGATSGNVVNVTITGVNDAPITVADAVAAQEDLIDSVTGNVLADDTDADQDTVLSVANAGVFIGNYGSLTLAAGGVYTYALDHASLAVQSLAAGQTVTESFDYQATDGLVSTPSTLSITLTGTNDVPVTTADFATVQKDSGIVTTGNVLSNDTDADQGSVLTVANAGLFTGHYGSLTLSADGSYLYALNNASLALQSLSAGQTVTDSFDYQATDGLLSSPSALTITLIGSSTNHAPQSIIPLLNQTAAESGTFSYQLPVNAFTDSDTGDRLSYGAKLSNGKPLPDWLTFNADTGTFSSTLPKDAAGLWDITVTATDVSGADAASAFRLDVADLIKGSGKEDVLNGTALRDLMYGLADDDRLRGAAEADILVGGSGNDVLEGDSGDDILIGGIPVVSTLAGAAVSAESSNHEKGSHGNDKHDKPGNNLLNGGAGNDSLIGGGKNDLLIGGIGNDILDTGTGANIIAFNRGDGQDSVLSGTGDNTLSLGGGIKMSDLHLRHLGNDLILETGLSGQVQDLITFCDWYASPKNRSIDTLQMIDNTEAKASKARIEQYDFSKLVETFDKAVASNATTDHWALTNAKLNKYLELSKGEALGGDLSYQYGKEGSLSAVSLNAAQDVMNSSSFCINPQDLHNLFGLADGLTGLA